MSNAPLKLRVFKLPHVERHNTMDGNSGKPRTSCIKTHGNIMEPCQKIQAFSLQKKKAQLPHHRPQPWKLPSRISKVNVINLPTDFSPQNLLHHKILRFKYPRQAMAAPSGKIQNTTARTGDLPRACQGCLHIPVTSPTPSHQLPPLYKYLPNIPLASLLPVLDTFPSAVSP